MKIDLDIERLSKAVQSKSVKQNIKKIDTQGTPAGISDTAQGLSKKRAFIDAIIVAQIAQSFFQSALVISSRLRNIASEAITTGKMNNDNLTAELKGIGSSLNELQKGPQPVPSTIVNYLSTYQYTGNLMTEIPELTEEINILNNFTDELSAGRSVDIKKIDALHNSIVKKESGLNDFYRRLITEVVTVNPQNITADFTEEIFTLTVDKINEKPYLSLSSQGNIDIEAVKSLI